MPVSLPAAIQKHRKQTLLLVGLYVIGFVFFMKTNPEELPLLLLILPFLYIFGVLYLTVLLVSRFIGIKSAAFVSLVISLFGVLLFVLGSLHQLTVRDVVISLALTSLLTWYIVRVTDKRA